MKSLDLSVIIPVFNEEKRVGKTLQAALSYLKSKKISAEILVVDDGSRDQTLQVVEKFKKDPLGAKVLKVLKHPVNRGKGAAVRTGALKARGSVVLYMDADNAMPLSEYEKFKGFLLKGEDVVIASRALDVSQPRTDDPFHRKIISWVGNVVIQLLVMPGIRDTQCGFKAFTKRAAQTIFPLQTIERFGFDVELLFIAKRHGFSITQTPVRCNNDLDSRVNPMLDPLRTLGEMVSIRWNILRGRYDR